MVDEELSDGCVHLSYKASSTREVVEMEVFDVMVIWDRRKQLVKHLQPAD